MKHFSLPTPKQKINNQTFDDDNIDMPILSVAKFSSNNINSINIDNNSTLMTNTIQNSINNNLIQDEDKAYTQYTKLNNLSLVDSSAKIDRRPTTLSISQIVYPLLTPADKVSSIISNTTSINVDILLKIIGFQNIPKILKHYKDVAQNSFYIQNLDRDVILDRGSMATMNKKN